MAYEPLSPGYALDLRAVEGAGSLEQLDGALKPLLERLGAMLLMAADCADEASAAPVFRSDCEPWPLTVRTRSDLRYAALAASAGRAAPVRLLDVDRKGEALRRTLSMLDAHDAFLVPRFNGRGRSVSLLAGKKLRLPDRASRLFAQVLVETGVETLERLQNHGRREVRLLTRRQRDCLDAALRGANSIQIGAELKLSPRTVDAYIAAAAQRLGAVNRVAAVGLAVQLGLIGGS